MFYILKGFIKVLPSLWAAALSVASRFDFIEDDQGGGGGGVTYRG